MLDALGQVPLLSLFMDTQSQLLNEIEAFLSARRMAATTFGRFAVNDGKFVGRLRQGANMTLATIDRVRGYLKEQNAGKSESQSNEAA